MKKGIDYPGVCVVFFCHDGRGEFIMNRRSAEARDEHGRWDIGGGGVKFGEKLEDALKREVNEEYCADLIGYEFLGHRDVHRMHGVQPTHWIAFHYLVQIDRSKAGVGDPLKMSEIRWFGISNKPRDDECHSQLPAFWKSHKDKLARALSTKIKV